MEHTPGILMWQEGPFRCELRTTCTPPSLCLWKYDESIIELAITSRGEAHDRAVVLRLVVQNNLSVNRWVEA